MMCYVNTTKMRVAGKELEREREREILPAKCSNSVKAELERREGRGGKGGCLFPACFDSPGKCMDKHVHSV
jgi:hypothetical protein